MIVTDQNAGEQRLGHFAEINKKSDRVMAIALVLYFLFGLVIAYYYQTYLIAIGVGALCLISYYVAKKLLPDSNLYQYVLSVVVGVFSALFIYQMHGMFEMHFFFFVGSALLITYQNWKLQIPLLVFVLLHHSSFAYLQYSGMKEIYFTQLDYMDLQSFIFHAVVAGIILFINAMWGYNLGKKTSGEMAAKTQLEVKVKNVQKNILFAEEISKGNLTSEYIIESEDDDLGKSLLKMQHNLVQSNKREQSEKYITTGLATIGDILRKNADDADALSYELIKEISKYTKSNQGGLFILEKDNNEEEYLKLAACYAYDRKKFIDKRVEIGESLVGQCFLEKDIIMMTQVPRDYVKITSGLGLATPSCIILVPLVSNEEVIGVIELASFETYEGGKLDFLKQASEAIASSFISVKTTQKIKHLLEDSQQRAEEMRAQEEEMRQNMEELSATQEEMLRNSSEMESRVSALNNSGIASIEFNLDGTIVTANASFLSLMGYSLDEIQGKHHRIFVTEAYSRTDAYGQFWNELAAGRVQAGEYERVTKAGRKVFISGSYSVIHDRNGKAIRVLKLATDITASRQTLSIMSQHELDIRQRAIELENRMRALNESGIASVEFDIDGNILTANETFLIMMGYTLPEIKGQHHRMFVDTFELKSAEYAEFWSNLRKGIPQPGEYMRIKKSGEPIYIKGSYSIIRDHNLNPIKILKLASLSKVEAPLAAMLN